MNDETPPANDVKLREERQSVFYGLIDDEYFDDEEDE